MCNTFIKYIKKLPTSAFFMACMLTVVIFNNSAFGYLVMGDKADGCMTPSVTCCNNMNNSVIHLSQCGDDGSNYTWTIKYNVTENYCYCYKNYTCPQGYYLKQNCPSGMQNILTGCVGGYSYECVQCPGFCTDYVCTTTRVYADNSQLGESSCYVGANSFEVNGDIGTWTYDSDCYYDSNATPPTQN